MTRRKNVAWKRKKQSQCPKSITNNGDGSINNDTIDATNSSSQSRKKSDEKLCIVCNKVEKKYKCPKCFSGYCSVDCYRQHKAICATATTTTTTTTTKPPPSSSSSSKYATITNNITSRKRPIPTSSSFSDDDDNDEHPYLNLTPEMKQKLSCSKWLRKELNDGGLRDIITNIVFSNNDGGGMTGKRMALMEAKRCNKNFASFVDELLLIMGVAERVGEDDDDGGEGGGGGGGLVLKLPQKKKKITTTRMEDAQNVEDEDDDDGTNGEDDDEMRSDCEERVV